MCLPALPFGLSHCWRQETACYLQTDNLAVRSGPVCWYWQLIYGSIKSESSVSEICHLVTTCRVHARCVTVCGAICGNVWHYMWHCVALSEVLCGTICGTVALCVTLYVIKCGSVYQCMWHCMCAYLWRSVCHFIHMSHLPS